ncbi:hypothetical protein ACGTJS_07515 [Faucicola mancuniensis]|uniref:hypothetical protein n=1 Tax=Faucicola mancuniensis TaxID=1309795 RepID=UPI003977B718
MKALFSVAILASVMALTACGGGSSDSSGSSSSIQPNTQPTPTTPTTPSTNPTIKACAIEGTTITGTKGEECTFNNPKYNKGATSTLECPVTGGVKLGGISAGTKIEINGMTLLCK